MCDYNYFGFPDFFHPSEHNYTGQTAKFVNFVHRLTTLVNYDLNVSRHAFIHINEAVNNSSLLSQCDR